MAHRMVETVTISMQVSIRDWSRSGPGHGSHVCGKNKNKKFLKRKEKGKELKEKGFVTHLEVLIAY